MKLSVGVLLLGIVVVVSSIPIEKRDSVEQNAVLSDPKALSRVIEEPKDDVDKPGSKDELEGAESAYFGFPYYYPYVYKYPVILYGK